MRRLTYGDSDQLLAGHTACRALQMLLLLLVAAAVPAAAAPFMSTDDPNTTTTEATTLPTDQQPLGALPEEERVAVMAYELAASLQRLAEQVAAGGGGDVTEEQQARIVTRQEDSREAPPRTTPLHRALALHHHSESTAKIISLSDRFHSILNRWVHATSNATYHKVMKVRAKITICFPFNVCFEIQDPWSLCCPF